jgi:hypothetical protein
MATKRKSTAIARRPAPAAHDRRMAKLQREIGRLHALTSTTPARTDERHELTDAVQLGNLGLVEVKLTADERAILARAVPPEQIEVKPNGAVYWPHIHYTRLFNEAFGPLGWTMVPAAKPLRVEREGSGGVQIVQPWILHVHGQPVAFAYGEQEYHATNRDQSFGDAVEATAASGLRRLAKRLGVGLELWDRDYGDAWLAQHAVQVVVRSRRDGRDHEARQWRRRAGRPLRGEVGAVRGLVAPAPDVIETEAVRYDAQPPQYAPRTNDTRVITEGQLKRLWAIARSVGRAKEDVDAYLRTMGVKHANEITRGQYDGIVAVLESGAPLRDPGIQG